MENVTMSMKDFNEQALNFRIPTLVFLGFMLPFGILGNASVIYIYGFRLKTCNVHLLIALLAVSDIISCLVVIPMEMHRLYFYYNYPSNATCKTLGFFGFACYISSMLMLLTISVERYVKVCRSTKTQMSRKFAKILAGAVFVSSLLLAMPLPRFSTLYCHSLHDSQYEYTYVQECTFIAFERAYKYWNLASFFIFGFLLIVFFVMFVLYWRVLDTVRELVHRRDRSLGIDTSQVPKSENDKKISRTNKTVIWVSAVYVASGIPYCITACLKLFLFRSMAPNPIDYLFFLALESWVLNCTINPIVYGYFNLKFRAEFHNLLIKFVQNPRRQPTR